MASTPILQLPYPAAADAPDGPGSLYSLVTALESNSTAVASTTFGTNYAARSGFLTITRRLPGGLVSGIFALQKSGSSITTSDTPLTLPVNYRPGSIYVFPVSFLSDANGTWSASTVPALINTNGTLQLTSVPGSPASISNVFGSFSYYPA